MLHYWYRVLIFFVNCVIIIRGDRVSSTNHCSVLPLSEPKCFSPTKDRTNKPETGVKEINFREKESDKDKITTNLGYGENIRLGEDYVDTFGTGGSVVKCEKQCLINKYKEKFEPKLYKRKNKDLNGDLESISFAQSFIITKREVWECKKENEEVAFLRIVTEILSKEAFGTVEFGDGFEVTALTIPYRQSTNSERYNNYIVAREIKYIGENDKTLRYDGVLKFMKPQEEVTDRRESVHISHYKDFTKLSTDKISNWEKNQKELSSDQEISYSQGNTLKNIKLDTREKSSRIIFTDKQPFTEDISSSPHNPNKAVCRIEEESKFCSLKYLPRWSYREKDDEGEKTADFLKSFIVTKHDIWKCTVQQMVEFNS
ncbi:uncharacterized protein LOC120351250 isoform X2 [Nilaparvata lugens]|uniref:uncharacterized protein LOC120351250 isoform X2 n=1 Tax=Nilaparvata lugens TaxID=108931 RepID=UPI00193D8BBA|nr:uncharacterized protein LOC120351250 isoform X2 [Nilaparvata lugens]